MGSYNSSHLADVRDPAYTARLEETLALLGLSPEARAGPARQGAGFRRATSEPVLAREGERAIHRGSGSPSSAKEAVLLALRFAHLDTDLVLPLGPIPPAGVYIKIR